MCYCLIQTVRQNANHVEITNWNCGESYYDAILYAVHHLTHLWVAEVQCRCIICIQTCIGPIEK